MCIVSKSRYRQSSPPDRPLGRSCWGRFQSRKTQCCSDRPGHEGGRGGTGPGGTRSPCAIGTVRATLLGRFQGIQGRRSGVVAQAAEVEKDDLCTQQLDQHQYLIIRCLYLMEEPHTFAGTSTCLHIYRGKSLMRWKTSARS